MVSLKYNALDNFIDYFFPSWALARSKARAKAFFVRSYDGASSGDRAQGWKYSSASADTENLTALEKLRFRSRELFRNNPYAVSIKNALVSQIVGRGITARARGRGRRQVKLDEAWKTWAGSKACDADGMTKFSGLQELVMGAVIESGAALIIRTRNRGAYPGQIPIKLRVLEPDFIDLNRTEGPLPGGGYIKQGIEFNADGERVGYWLFDEHPGETGPIRGFSFTSRRYSADDVKHVFLRLRPGQNHGIPWLSVIMRRLFDYDDFEDARLVREKIAACFTVFIKDLDGQGDDKNELKKLLPGRVEKLPPGRDVTIANPPAVDGYGEYSNGQKLAFAIGAGLSYEAASGDLSRTQFSGARIGQETMHRNADRWQENFFAPGFCDPVWEWFEGAAELAGIVRPGGPVGAEWTPQPRPFMEPVKDTNSRKNQVRAGMKTPSQMVREQGRAPEEHWQEYADDLERLKGLGITLSSVVMPGEDQADDSDQVDDQDDENQEKTGDEADKEEKRPGRRDLATGRKR